MTARIIKIELSAIYITAALLLLSVMGLVGKAVAASAAADYPNLRVTPPGEFVTPRQKTVYFTFDDGPSKNTEKVLDALAAEGIKATFFVSAQNAEEAYAPVLLARIVDEGHTLGLHSYSHRFDKIYTSVDSCLSDLNRLNDYLYETVGVRPAIFRFPGGSATVNASVDVLKGVIAEMTDRGYLYYDWHVSGGDDTTTLYPAEDLARRMVDSAKEFDYPVILLHDSPFPTTTADAVVLAARELRREGYAFDRLTPQVEPVHIKTTRYTLD